MVKINIGNNTSRIIGHLDKKVHNELDHYLSYVPANARHMKSVKDGKWDGRFRLYRKGYGQSFDSGLVSLVQKVLEKNDVHYVRNDERIKPKQNLPHLIFQEPAHYEERDYQQFTINKALKRSRGILKISTGGGKTMIVSELISRLKTAPFMYYVLTKDLMNQAYETLSESLNEPIGRIGGGHWDIKNINVCTIQTVILAVNQKNKKFKISDYQFDEEDIWDETIYEYEDKIDYLKKLLRFTKGLYVDECHHSSARTCQEVIKSSPNAYFRYGGSATPYREDGAEIVLKALFGKKIVDISA